MTQKHFNSGAKKWPAEELASGHKKKENISTGNTKIIAKYKKNANLHHHTYLQAARAINFGTSCKSVSNVRRIKKKKNIDLFM